MRKITTQDIICLLAMILLCSAIVPVLDSIFPLSGKAIAKTNEEPSRFSETESFIFRNGSCAHIYIDTKTNIKYLYIHRGKNLAAITRLWEK